MSSPCPRANNGKTIHNGHSQHAHVLGDRDTRGGGGEEEGEGGGVAQNPQNGLATKRSRAIDLSCRACGCGREDVELGTRLPGWGTFGSTPPTSDLVG